MSTTYQRNPRRSGIAVVALAVCAWVLLIAVGCSNAAKPADSAKVADKAKVSGTNTNSVVAYETTSVFDDDPKKSKDPFFPKSQRLAKHVVTPGKTVQEAPRVTELHLRGVIGSPGRFIAMINDKTFATGEKSQVAVGPGQYLVVKVTKITERSVTVSVDGEAAPRELSLEPTQEAKK
jgi:hypothetical protein